MAVLYALTLTVAVLLIAGGLLANRPGRRGIATAAIGGVAAGALGWAWDRLAVEQGWWWHPGVPGGLPPGPFFAALALVIAGFVLVAWRAIATWPVRRLALVAVLASAIAVLRTEIWSTILRSTGFVVLGPGIVPVAMVALCTLSLLAVVLIVGLVAR